MAPHCQLSLLLTTSLTWRQWLCLIVHSCSLNPQHSVGHTAVVNTWLTYWLFNLGNCEWMMNRVFVVHGREFIKVLSVRLCLFGFFLFCSMNSPGVEWATWWSTENYRCISFSPLLFLDHFFGHPTMILWATSISPFFFFQLTSSGIQLLCIVKWGELREKCWVEAAWKIGRHRAGGILEGDRAELHDKKL